MFWFEVTLPVTEVAVEARSAHPPDRVITGYKGPRRKVLVVDDIPSNRAVLVGLLEPLGFDLVEAADGQQAIALAQETQPDLILMDRRMPGFNGLEAAQQLRRIPELQGIPLINVSASVSEADQALSREVGYDAFLPKPINWPRLAALLEEYLKLEWEYDTKDEGGGMKDESLLPPSAFRSHPSEMVPPPPEELAVLYKLARLEDMRHIRAKAADLETLGEQFMPFARKLRELAQGYQAKATLALIEQYLDREAEQ
ncbi:MAG: response regulator [Chloroflexi bacterium]|nr:response regulator [Chloroflexota bacterium]